MHRRRAATLVEAILALTLALGAIGFVMGAYWVFGTRSGEDAQSAAELREASLFVERLRRILKAGVVRVTPTARGFKLIHWQRMPDGSWRLVETLFETTGEPGVLVIVKPDGTRRIYRVGEAEDGELVLHGSERDNLIHISVGGLKVVQRLGPPVSPRGTDRPRVLVAPGARGATLEGARAELEERGGLVPTAPGLVDLGTGRIEDSGYDGARETAEVGAAIVPRVLDESFEQAADVTGMELTDLGQIFLPPEPPPEAVATPLATIQERLEGAGYGPAQAAAMAEEMIAWEGGVLSGDRRQAAEALHTLERIGLAEGLDHEGIAETLLGSSDLATALGEANPEPLERIAAGAEPTIQIPESLRDPDVDPEAVAGLPGGPGDPGEPPLPEGDSPPPEVEGTPMGEILRAACGLPGGGCYDACIRKLSYDGNVCGRLCGRPDCEEMATCMDLESQTDPDRWPNLLTRCEDM